MLQLYALIERIGEAAAHVSAAFRKQHPEVPWQNVVGMRHKVIHDYFEIVEVGGDGGEHRLERPRAAHCGVVVVALHDRQEVDDAGDDCV
jgi:hypothetical protein